jgi:hypothetical protein
MYLDIDIIDKMASNCKHKENKISQLASGLLQIAKPQTG